MQIRVHENTHAKLSIGMTPTGAWLLVVFGILLLALGTLIVYMLGWTVTIEIKDGSIRHRAALLQRLLPKEMTIPSAEIEGFASEIRYGIGYATTVVVAQSANGNQDIRVGDMSGDDKETLVEELNVALLAKSDYLYSTGDAPIWGSMLFGGLISALGLLCLLYLQTSWVYADRTSAQICVATKRWLIPWAKTSARCVAIADFSRVNHSDLTVGEVGTPTASSNYVSIETLDGELVPLANGPMFTAESTEEIDNLITDWVKRSSPNQD